MAPEQKNGSNNDIIAPKTSLAYSIEGPCVEVGSDLQEGHGGAVQLIHHGNGSENDIMALKTIGLL